MQSERKKRLSRATVGTNVTVMKRFFERARKEGYIESNPFANLKFVPEVNPARLMFVSRETIQKVLDACACPQMRLIIACRAMAACAAHPSIRH